VRVTPWTRVRLSQWGRWCRGRIMTGYPSASAFTHANEGARSLDEGTMPAEIEEIDRAVAAVRDEQRQALFACYVWVGPFTLRAIRLRWSVSTLRRRVADGEREVERNLSQNVR
jgi:DNA-directed RNA polymerase specialized sigma24 family protein